MARGNIQNLKKAAPKVFRKVERSRAQMRCGTSPRGARNRVCVSTHTIPGMSCGLNKVTGLYGCAVSASEKPRRKRRK